MSTNNGQRAESIAPRSFLFVPGDRADRFDKAANAGADAIILDLEDAVTPDKRDAATTNVSAWLNERQASDLQVWVRVPEPDQVSEALEKIASAPAFTGFMLPKVESPDQVAVWRWPVIAQIESARGVLAVAQIAAHQGNLRGLTLGAEDLSLSLNCLPDAAGMTGSAQQLILAARAYDLHVYACPGSIAQFKDLQAWQSILDQGKGLGSDGQLCIHPAQVAPVNQTFSPSDQAIQQARRIIETFEAALKQGHAAVQLDGQMLDAPVVARARQLLARI
jgi:citrate lyase subunit beta/citryl-CoA lyase